MKNKLIKLLAGIALLVCSTGFAGEYNTILSIGDSMPRFTKLPTTDDKPLSSSDIKESVVVLVSLANHCPWVRGMDADLVKLAKEFADKDVHIIGLSVNHSEADRLPAMKEHAKKNGYTFTYVYDESQALGRALGATRTPEYFVFDKDRKLVYMGLLYDSPAKMDGDGTVQHINGEPKKFYVHDAITSTLKGETVETVETRAHGCTVKYES